MSSGLVYYPMVRGRQNELLAIRALSDAGMLNKICPVIEPVKASRTLIKTLRELCDRGNEAYIVENPQVGSFDADLQRDEVFYSEYFDIRERGKDSLKSCIVLDSKSPLPSTWVERSQAVLVSGQNQFDEYRHELVSMLNATIFTPFAMYISELPNKDRLVRLDTSSFNIRERNSDYRSLDDEPFLSDMSGLSSWFSGLADYSVIGSVFNEGGFMPRAVAFHIIYPSDSERLRIHHFISDVDLDGSRDVARMYYTAVCSFEKWYKENGWGEKAEMCTAGINELLRTAEEGSFPGLGALKKFCFMHHLELMNTVLS